MSVAARPTVARAPRDEVQRYTLFDRVLHWAVAASFIYLMVSGFALGYPRVAFLYDILGGGQTVRFVHPIAGVVFTVGILLMLVAWLRDMRFEKVDREWFRHLRQYSVRGHVDI